MCARRFVLQLLILVIALVPVARPVVAVSDLYTPILLTSRDRVVEQTKGEVSTYSLDLAFDPAASLIGGRERIDFVNRYQVPLSEVAFRLYPNAFYYGEGGTTIDDVRVAGEPASSTLDVGDTVFRVLLPNPLEPGESVRLSFRFQTTIPTDSDGTYGIFSHETRYDTWILADWYPIIAGFESGAWWLDPPTPDGDPTFSDAALYDVSIIAPEGLKLIGTGRAIETADSDDRTTNRFLTGPVREFTLVADANLQATSTDVDGTTVNLYLNLDTSVRDGAQIALATAAAALRAYSARYGEYPYDELDLVETDLSSSVLAVSWSGLIFLEGPGYLAGLESSDEVEGADFTIAHEVGHQWWGAVVGANSNDHTYMNEGLDNALASIFFEDTFGKVVAREQIQQQIAGRYLNALAQSGDGVVDLPLAAPRQGPSRGALDYGKAAIGFLAIRQEIGDDAFFGALATYADRFAFDNATPDDLREAFERASGEDLKELWRFWFNAAETTSEDVARVIGA